MAITHFNWIIEDLVRHKENDGVFIVSWICFGFDEAHWQNSISGTVELNPNPSDPKFIPFENLTEEKVFEWVYSSGVDKDAVEKQITENIEKQINPTEIRGKPSAWYPQQPDKE